MTPKYIWMRPILGMLMAAGFLAVTGYTCYKIFALGFDNVDREIIVLFGALVQALILMAKDGYSFYFGTSQGSSNKSEMIDKMLNGTGPGTPAPQDRTG